MKSILTISVISDDNTRNDLKSYIFDDFNEAKRVYSEYLQTLFNECARQGYPIDFEHTYIFDKNNGTVIMNVIDPFASKEAGTEIMHRYNVSISTVED